MSSINAQANSPRSSYSHACSRRGERGRRAPESVLQHCSRVRRDRDRPALTPLRCVADAGLDELRRPRFLAAPGGEDE